MGQIKLSEYSTFLFYKNLSIAANLHSGQWVKFPKQCYEIIQTAVNNEMTERQVLKSMYDDIDRSYIKKLIAKFKEIGILSTEDSMGVECFDDITLTITHRCNLKCKHCSASASGMNEEEYLTLEEIYNTIDKIKECNPKTIVLTGGEPLVRKDFINILKYTRNEYTGNIILMTNGTLITTQMASMISKYVTSVDLSIDGIDEASCSQIRGKGVFKKVINAIHMLQENNVKYITVSMVTTPQNYQYKKQFIELCNGLGVKPVFRNFEVVGRAKDNVEELNKIYNESKVLAEQNDNIEKKVCICLAGKKAF